MRRDLSVLKPDTRNWFQRNFGRKCPSCGQKGLLQQTNSSVVDTRTVYKLFPREKTVKNRDGDIIRTEEWKETLPIIRNTIRVECRCSNCGSNSYYTEVDDEDPEE
jgi:hypothetical protein